MNGHNAFEDQLGNTGEASVDTVKEASVERYTVKETRSFWNDVFEWVDSASITIMCLLLVFTFFFRQVKIDGDSMNPTLQNGQRVIVSDLFYTPKYGDIVVVSSEVYNNVPIIKRVIATEGQTVDIRDGIVYVAKNENSPYVPVGNEFVENEDLYTYAVIPGNYGHHDYPLKVPSGKIFVLGDNRSDSVDSRTLSVGLIDERQVLGKALYRIYPFDKFGNLYK